MKWSVADVKGDKFAPDTIGLTQLQQELGSIFAGYTILSSKILRDSMGNSRGVGFARYVREHFASYLAPVTE